MAKEASQSKPRNFKVLPFKQVGGWTEGCVFSESDLPEGAKIQRFIDQGDVAEVTEDAGPMPVGPHSMAKDRPVVAPVSAPVVITPAMRAEAGK